MVRAWASIQVISVAKRCVSKEVKEKKTTSYCPVSKKNVPYSTKCNKTMKCLWLSLFTIRNVFANSEPCKACYKQSVTVPVVQAAQVAGQIQANSSPEKRGDLRIPGTLAHEIIYVKLLAAPATELLRFIQKRRSSPPRRIMNQNQQSFMLLKLLVNRWLIPDQKKEETFHFQVRRLMNQYQQSDMLLKLLVKRWLIPVQKREETFHYQVWWFDRQC